MGLKFRPNDEEKIKYLVGKVFGTLGCDEDLIRTEDLYGEQEPWEIFRDWGDTELHVFTPLKKVGNQKTGQRISRNVGQGVWSNKGQKDEIFGGNRGGQVIGHKRSFRYERKKKKGGGDDDDDGKGKWLLKEYTLPDRMKGRAKEERRDFALCVLKRKKEDGAGRRKNHNDCPDVEIGFEEMMELVRNGPQAQAVPSCSGGGGGDEEEDWLEMIDWNVPGDVGGDFDQGGKNVVDWNVEPCDFVGDVVEPGGDLGGFDQGNDWNVPAAPAAAAAGGDFDGFDGVVDWNDVPGGDFDEGDIVVDWNDVPGGFDEQGKNVVVPYSVEDFFGIDDYLPAHQSRRLSAPLIFPSL